MVIRRLNGYSRTRSFLFLYFVCLAMLFMGMRLKWGLMFPLCIAKCLSCTWERSNLSEIQSLLLNKCWERKTYGLHIDPFYVVWCLSVGYHLFGV